MLSSIYHRAVSDFRLCGSGCQACSSGSIRLQRRNCPIYQRTNAAEYSSQPVPGSAGLKDDEISIQTRSVMAMMEFMARGVEVPVKHLEDGWVIDYGLQNSEGEMAEGRFPFRMRSSKKRPENVFAAVRFRDHWYYIDEADITSKRALSLIIVLFRLQAPTPSGAAPILTLPTG